MTINITISVTAAASDKVIRVIRKQNGNYLPNADEVLGHRECMTTTIWDGVTLEVVEEDKEVEKELEDNA